MYICIFCEKIKCKIDILGCKVLASYIFLLLKTGFNFVHQHFKVNSKLGKIKKKIVLLPFISTLKRVEYTKIIKRKEKKIILNNLVVIK